MCYTTLRHKVVPSTPGEAASASSPVSPVPNKVYYGGKKITVSDWGAPTTLLEYFLFGAAALFFLGFILYHLIW